MFPPGFPTIGMTTADYPFETHFEATSDNATGARKGEFERRGSGLLDGHHEHPGAGERSGRLAEFDLTPASFWSADFFEGAHGLNAKGMLVSDLDGQIFRESDPPTRPLEGRAWEPRQPSGPSGHGFSH